MFISFYWVKISLFKHRKFIFECISRHLRGVKSKHFRTPPPPPQLTHLYLFVFQAPPPPPPRKLAARALSESKIFRTLYLIP